MSVERVENNGELLGIIIRNSFNKEGTSFFTEDEHSFQIALHNAEKVKRYRAHVSLPPTCCR